jgi:diacylglycerol kinase (ATP)
MTTTSVPLFLNPVAGRGRARRRLARIRQIFEDAGLRVEVRESTGVGDLEAQVRAAVGNGAARVVVAGGDGSICEALNGMLGAGSAALGVIPTGTGNDFAKACGISLAWEDATRALAERIAAGRSLRRIDAGRMNGRYFANGAGVGFDAKVTQAARSIRWPIGDLVYLVAILRCLADGITTPELTIAAPGFDWQGPVTLANVANGPWLGGMFHIAPMADNGDARFELLIARPVTRRRLLALLPKLVRGEHVGELEITHASVGRVVIAADAPVPAHVDGEVMEPDTRFEIEMLPGVLEIL